MWMQKLLGLLFTLTLLMMVAPVASQDDPCGLREAALDLSAASLLLTTTDDPVASLEEIATLASETATACREAGLDEPLVAPEADNEQPEAFDSERVVITFSSSDMGLQPLIGPVEIPTGVYKVTATTTGYMIAELITNSGECIALEGTLFNFSAGQGDMGAETVLASDSCEALIEVRNTREGWELRLEQMLITDAVPLEAQYSSDELGMMPVIGLVEIPAGRYRVTATTTGYMIAELLGLEGECTTTRGDTFFNLSAGQGDMGAQTVMESSGCTAVIPISNTRDRWTLEFEALG